MPCKTLDEAIEIIRADYLDMPGLALTFWQAQRLWNLSEELCELALVKLVRARFLMPTTSGRYVRRAQPRRSLFVQQRWEWCSHLYHRQWRSWWAYRVHRTHWHRRLLRHLLQQLQPHYRRSRPRDSSCINSRRNGARYRQTGNDPSSASHR